MGAVRARLDHLAAFDALALTALVWFLGKFARYAFPPLFETFQGAYGVSNTALGLLYTALMLAYAAMQFPSGAMADRFGMVRVITVGAIILSGGAALLVASQTFAVLVAGAVLIGIGTGTHKTVAINLLSAIYPSRTGRTLGIMDAIGSLGGVAAPAAVVLVLSVAAGWPALFLGVGVGGVVLAVAFYHRVAGRPPGATGKSTRRSTDASSGDTYFSSFFDPRFGSFVAVVVTFGFAWNGLNAFLPLYLVSEKSVSSSHAGLLYSTLFVASLVQPVTGSLGDRFGELRIIAGTVGLAGGGLALLLVTDGPLALAGVITVVGIGVHGFRPIRDAYLVRLIPTSVGGGTLGVVRTLAMVAGAAAPAIVGYLSEVAGFDVALATLLGAVAASFVIVVALIGIGGAASGDQ